MRRIMLPNFFRCFSPLWCCSWQEVQSAVNRTDTNSSIIIFAAKNLIFRCLLHYETKILFLPLTFKNRASYIWDGRTVTLQMLHFIYFFQQI